MSRRQRRAPPSPVDLARLQGASTSQRVHLSRTYHGVEQRCVLYAEVELSPADRDALMQRRDSLQQQHALLHAPLSPSLKVLDVSAAELDSLLFALRCAAQLDSPPGNELLDHDGDAPHWTSHLASLQRLLRDCRFPYHDVNELTVFGPLQEGQSAVDPLALGRFNREWKDALSARPVAYRLPATVRFFWLQERVVPFNAKVDVDGRYCSFPGLSVVAMAAPDARLSALYERLQQSPISQYYSPLPPSSYHVTVNDGVVKHRNPQYEQQRSHALQALSSLQQRMRGMSPLKCRVLGVEMGSIIALKLRFRSAQGPLVDGLRRGVQAALGAQHSAAVFHMTLGYLYQQHAPRDELLPAFKQLLTETLGSGKAKLRLEAPDVVTFDSMDEFEPVTCLPVSSSGPQSSSALSFFGLASANSGSSTVDSSRAAAPEVSVTQDAVHVVVVLDRSGSMEGIREDMVVSLNSFIQNQQEQQRQQGADAGDTRISLLQFDTRSAFTFIDRPLLDCPVITMADYVLGGGTALYDALSRVLDAFDSCHGCILAVITDGQDNGSLCRRSAIAARIAEKRQHCGWDVHYLSADVAAFAEAQALGSTSAARVRGAALPASVSTTLSAAISSSRSYRSSAATFTGSIASTAGSPHVAFPYSASSW